MKRKFSLTLFQTFQGDQNAQIQFLPQKGSEVAKNGPYGSPLHGKQVGKLRSFRPCRTIFILSMSGRLFHLNKYKLYQL